MSNKERSIEQEVLVPTTPERVFEVLTRGDEFSRLSGGAPAQIGADGETFSLFGGMILGRNLELVPGERVVQAWRAKTWAPGHYSIVRFDLKSVGQGTAVALTHVGFPPDQQAHLSSGWSANYLDPLRKLFS
jgi:uncharacterized protein YndB with AHSA1/START domain